MLLCMVMLTCYCRFLNQISVRERYSNLTSNFVCDMRLYPKEERKIARYHLHMTEIQPLTYTFRVMSLQCIRDQHMWISIFLCPKHSTFTRVQRLSCGFAIVLSSMFANIMFYKARSAAHDQLLFDEFSITLGTLVIGIESAIIIIPINGLILLIFRYVAVEEEDFVVHYGGNHDDENSAIRGDTDSEQMHDAKTEGNDSNDMSSGESSSGTNTHSKGKIRKSILVLARMRLASRTFKASGDASAVNRSSSNSNSSSKRNRNRITKRNRNRNSIRIKNKISNTSISIASITSRDRPISNDADWCTLPWWWVYIGWTMTVITCLVSSFFVIVYGLSNTHYKNVAWTLSFFLSTSGDVCVIQPIKVTLFVVILTLLLNRPVTPTFEARNLENLGTYI